MTLTDKLFGNRYVGLVANFGQTSFKELVRHETSHQIDIQAYDPAWRNARSCLNQLHKAKYERIYNVLCDILF